MHFDAAAFGPTPVHAGLLDADGAGRWGLERDFGGRYVPETLMAALEQLETAYNAVRQDPVFWAELRELLEHFAGRPTALHRADRLAEAFQVSEANPLFSPSGMRMKPAAVLSESAARWHVTLSESPACPTMLVRSPNVSGCSWS